MLKGQDLENVKLIEIHAKNIESKLNGKSEGCDCSGCSCGEK